LAGSGKTHAYLLPLLSLLDEHKRLQHASVTLGVLVVVPTRELAHQVCSMLSALASSSATKDARKGRSPLIVRKVVGDLSTQRRQTLISDPGHVVVGTPQAVRRPCATTVVMCVCVAIGTL
jgi:superfamily II DNA/RNA helicase